MPYLSTIVDVVLSKSFTSILLVRNTPMILNPSSMNISNGCGACIVLLSKFDSDLNQVEDHRVSSCLTLLCSVNGCSITTTEGLGNSKDGFHSIHQRIAGFHASQCGFCTPGMCVSLFSALVNAEKTHRPEPAPGLSKLTVSEAEKSISGNLCRCTGYRPIEDVCISFAADVDMEDLGLNAFWTKDAKLDKLPVYDPKQICTYPEFLKHECKSPMVLTYQNRSWHTPVSMEELGSLLEGSKGVTVIIADDIVLPFADAIPWKDIGVYVDEKDVPNLDTILTSIPTEVILRKQRLLANPSMKQAMLFPHPAQPGDAFHQILKGLKLDWRSYS